MGCGCYYIILQNQSNTILRLTFTPYSAKLDRKLCRGYGIAKKPPVATMLGATMMRRVRYLCYLSLLLGSFLRASVALAYAETPPALPSFTVAASVATLSEESPSGIAQLPADPRSLGRTLSLEDKNLDLTIVIDNSGSMMGSAGADPTGLRFSAAKMLVDLVSNQDRVGVVVFSTTHMLVTTELEPMTSTEKRDNLKSKINDIQNRSGELAGNTHYLEALKGAKTLLPDGRSNQGAVIFLTDGLPTEGSGAVPGALQPFIDAKIPVFLMLLAANDLQFGSATVMTVESAFRATNAPSFHVLKAEDIAQNFALALTQLQPELYLDPMSGSEGAGGKLRYSTHADPSQAIERITYVYVAKSAQNPNLVVEPDGVPGNVRASSAADPNYAILTYESDNNQPLNGDWNFNAPKDVVKAFAFLRSDVRLQLAYPAGATALSSLEMPKDQSLLIGARAAGLSAGHTELRATLYAEPGLLEGEEADRCFRALSGTAGGERQGQNYNLQAVGLSEDGSLYWQEVKAPNGGADPVLVKVQLGQLDKPLRLSKCYVVRPGPNVGELEIVKPIETSALKNDGGIPLLINLPEGIAWAQPTAFIEAPDGTVQSVPLNAGEEAVSHTVSKAGDYHIRYVVQSSASDEPPVTLFRETKYTVESTVDRPAAPIELGDIKTLDATLEGEITWNITLPDGSTRIVPTELGVTRREFQSDQEIAFTGLPVDLCQETPARETEIKCSITIRPPNILPPGLYKVMVGGEVRDNSGSKALSPVEVTFTRPQSVLKLENDLSSENGITLGAFGPQTSVVSTTLTFSGVLWSGDPRLSVKTSDIDLRDESGEIIDASNVTVDLTPVKEPEDLEYRLFMKAQEDLPPGKTYTAKLELATGIAELELEPDMVVVNFGRPQSLLKLATPLNEDGVLELGSFTPETPILTKTLSFDPVQWEGDPGVLSIKLGEIYNEANNEALDPDVLKAEIRAVKESGKEYSYQLTLSPNGNDDIPVGLYSAELKVISAKPNLTFDPKVINLQFSKPGEKMILQFTSPSQDYKEGIWGIPFFPEALEPLFSRTSYMDVPLDTEYISGEPQLPDPSIANVTRGNDRIDPSAFHVYWRNDGRTLGQRDQYNYSLILKLLRSIDEGKYTLRLQMPDSVTLPSKLPDQDVNVTVLGWGDFLGQRVTWALLIAFLMLAFGRRILGLFGGNRLAGTLVVLDTPLRLNGKGERYIGFDSTEGRICLTDAASAEAVVRPRGRNALEIDFRDGEDPLVIRRYASLGPNLRYE